VSAPTDEQLLAEYLAGRKDRFEVLVRRYTQELYRFLVRLTGSASAAEDIVQETFLQVHISAESFDTRRRFKPWLFTIAANKARDLLRSRTRRPEVPLDAQLEPGNEQARRFADLLADVAADPSEPLQIEEERRLVRQIVEAMPEHLKEVLVLSYYHRFAYKEMAAILDIPLGTVKSRLHAAVAHFARAYQAARKTRPGEADEANDGQDANE